MNEYESLLNELENGRLRVAQPSDDGQWRVNTEIKERILELFRASPVVAHSAFGSPHKSSPSPFWDKELLPARQFQSSDGVRIVPGGSTVRRGAFVSKGVILMPPIYINIGAYVDEGSMIDSHALVGSCAQIGRNVHLSAAAQIGGVLEPPSARPVIVEDDAFIGGNCGLYDGVLVRHRAVIGAGVVLTGRSRVFDLVQQREWKGSDQTPLEIPSSAVVVPGSRPSEDPWARERGLQIQCPLIVKYRDTKTDVSTALEEALRTPH